MTAFYWALASGGDWNALGNWYFYDAASGTYQQSIPDNDAAVDLTPTDATGQIRPGISPFTVTYSLTSTIYSLRSPSFSMLKITSGQLSISGALQLAGALNNAGLLDLGNTGGQSSSISGAVSNTGSIVVEGGALTLAGSLSTSANGSLSVGSGASLLLNGGGTSGNAPITLASGSQMTVGGGTFTVGSGGISGPGAITLTGGTLSIHGEIAGPLVQRGGTLSGSVTLDQGITVSQGVATFDGYQLSLRGTSTISSSASLVLKGYMSDEGIVNWSADPASIITIQILGGLTTAPVGYGSGVFNVSGAGEIRAAAVGRDNIQNCNVFAKIGNDGRTLINAGFQNFGTIHVDVGTLDFAAPFETVASTFATSEAPGIFVKGGATVTFENTTSTGSAPINLDAGATLVFAPKAASTQLLIGDGGMTGAGDVVLKGGETVILPSSLTITGSWTQSGGRLTDYGVLNLAGGLNVTGNCVMLGHGTAILGGTSIFYTDLPRSNALVIDPGFSVVNEGSLQITNVSIIIGIAGDSAHGMLENAAGATLECKSDVTIGGYNAADVFLNEGTLRVTGGTTRFGSHIGGTFVNDGTTSIEAGLTYFSGSVTNNGLVSAAGIGTVVEVDAPIGGNGIVRVGAGAIVQFDALTNGNPSVGSGQTLQFDTTANQGATVIIAGTALGPTTFAAVISHFQAQDTIDLAGQIGLSVRDFDGSLLTLALASGATETLTFTGLRVGQAFALTSQGTGTAFKLGAPVVSLGVPGLVTNQAVQTIGGVTDAMLAGCAVAFYDNGGATPLATSIVGTDGTFGGAVTLSGEGTHLIVARLMDRTGQVGSATVTYTLDTVAPQVTVGALSPLSNENRQTLTGQVADLNTGSIVTVVDQYNGTTSDIGTAAISNGAFQTDIVLSGDGRHVLTVRTIDQAGNSGTSGPSTVTLDTVAPSVMTSLADHGGDALVSEAMQTVVGTVTDLHTGQSVDLYDNATRVTIVGSGPGGGYTASVTLAEGKNVIVAKATDGAGNVGASALLNVVYVGADTFYENESALSVADLTLHGSTVIRNTGTLTMDGTVTIGDDSGLLARLANPSGGAYLIDGDFKIDTGRNIASNFNNNGGLLAKISGQGTATLAARFQDGNGASAQIRIASGTLNFTGAANSFVNQAISGAGTFAIGGGGASTIGVGTTIATAGWTIAKVGTTVTLGETLAYAGRFVDTNATTLSLGTDTLTLSGPVAFNLGPAGAPRVTGSGKLVTNGATTIAGLEIGGSALFRNNGNATQAGTIVLGDSSNGSTQVTNAAGATWTLTGDIGIFKGSTAAAFNTGGGSLSKAGGTGISTIGVNVVNLNGATSQITVASGTLDFAGMVSGNQAFTINAGKTLAFDASVGTGSAVAFAGAGGVLLLNDAQDFNGSITGFGAGQTLDLASIGLSSPGAMLTYAGSTLTVVGGGKTASLAIGAGYNSASFHRADDAHGGSLITYG